MKKKPVKRRVSVSQKIKIMMILQSDMDKMFRQKKEAETQERYFYLKGFGDGISHALNTLNGNL